MTTTLVTAAMEKQTVAVTGGCGFLGQHLIKLLHTHTTNVQCVRVLDFMAFKNELEYEPMVEMHSIIGSVTSMEDLLTATNNVTTVFHLASISDNHMFPDRDILQLVNVEGTRNVIEACKLNGVKNLIYVSDVTVVKDLNSIIKGTEGTTCYPANHLHLDGWSKCEAEKLVLSANGDPLGQDMSEDSGTLKTVAIRLLTLYGEMDSSLLPHVVSVATANDGHLVCVGSVKSKSHMMYVGNAAWALICAFTKLNKDQSEVSPVTTKSSQAADDTHSHPHGTSTSKGRSIAKRFAAAAKARTTAKEDPPVTQQQPADAAELEDAEEVVVEGKAYFVRDDTPPRNFFLIMQPILVRYGFFLTSWVVPERWAKVIYMLVYVMLWLVYPLIHYNPNLSFGNIHELCRTYTFKDTLARKNLDYSPIFTRKDAFQRTVRMYDLKYKEAMYGCLENRALASRHVALLRQMPKLKRLITSLDLTDNGRRFRAKATRQYEMTLPW